MIGKHREEQRKAEILVEALPYIKKFHGKIVVVKYGGNAMVNEALKQNVFQDIVLMKLVGMNPIVVHGGGPDISNMLKRLSINTHFVDGLRYTSKEVMEVAEMVLVGKVNNEVVAGINSHGGTALGMCGKDGNMIVAEKYMPVKTNKEGIKESLDLGYVGKIKSINKQVILDLVQGDYIPVIAPVAIGEDGESYNINADFMASEIAGAIEADKLVLLTDTEGIYKQGMLGLDKKVFKRLHIDQLGKLIKDRIISGGMIPKVQCCADALEKGVKQVHILDGRISHSILLEVFTNEGVGTMLIQ